MNTKILIFNSVIITAIISLSGCVSTGKKSTGFANVVNSVVSSSRPQAVSSNNKQVVSPRADRYKIASLRADQNKTILQGCLGGAAAGGLINLFNNSSKNLGRNMLIGVAVGCGAGYIIAQKKKQAVSAEVFLNDEIQHVSATNRDLRRYNDNVRTDIRLLRTELIDLDRKYKHGLVSKQTMLNKQREIEQDIKIHKDTIKQMQKEHEYKLAVYKEEQQAGGNTQKLALLRNEINELKDNINELENSQGQLASMNLKVSI